MRRVSKPILPVLVVLALGFGGCGSNSGDQGTQPGAGTAATPSPESGTQASAGFPGAGNPKAPDVTTTPGKPATESKGKAGGGSSATCIGC